ncbi:MAG: hypothetical protein UY48_C0005G0044 [Candidatus Gottesmanbacteria bacterium GW2011_GWB1_49_7]|uniref:Uncharacterized protein n=1 Tax=Candidatus Gottesmanbacteria bacterium GW2011_GWB1_49_7 TaxID=1618448 RepID=A0A0G1W2Y5_9BACT|nr:MAG: hypothetical protein UY48_C0005G0044 [Candidatus Gottesmanbacteria bacterium GW2011_GWB1_49_7]
MIERVSHNSDWETFEVSCDTCSYSETFEDMTWKEMIQEMKDTGWRFSKEDDEWIHRCPTCVGKRPAINSRLWRK